MVSNGTLKKVSLSTNPGPNDLAKLKLGNIVYLNGVVYTGREGVYMKVLEEGAKLPMDLPSESAANFHCSPAAAPRARTLRQRARQTRRREQADRRTPSWSRHPRTPPWTLQRRSGGKLASATHAQRRGADAQRDPLGGAVETARRLRKVAATGVDRAPCNDPGAPHLHAIAAASTGAAGY